ncbi:MAG: energy transducer TonB [Duncaniella sp.]|nr:energy transducer TonB [Duncaniella sp.]
MTRGKTTCRILKEIRRQIAEANDIKFVTSECRYQGDCAGTCPKCEAEVRYLEMQLSARRIAGKAIAFAGISAAVLAGVGTTIEAAAMPTDALSVSCDDEKHTLEREEVVVGGIDVQEELMRQEGDDYIYNVVEHKPQFPGGEVALLKYVADHMQIPSACLEWSSARVVVRFVVTKTGEVGRIEVVRSAGEPFDSEAVNAVKKLPKFVPGKMGDKPVNTWYIVPVQFKNADYHGSK